MPYQVFFFPFVVFSGALHRHAKHKKFTEEMQKQLDENGVGIISVCLLHCNSSGSCFSSNEQQQTSERHLLYAVPHKHTPNRQQQHGPVLLLWKTDTASFIALFLFSFAFLFHVLFFSFFSSQFNRKSKQTTQKTTTQNYVHNKSKTNASKQQQQRTWSLSRQPWIALHSIKCIAQTHKCQICTAINVSYIINIFCAINCWFYLLILHIYFYPPIDCVVCYLVGWLIQFRNYKKW